MIVGNMGSRTLFDYTVMGDNVNIGARLENANKNFGTEIIIGENTYAAVHETFEARRLGLVHVKGRSKPVGAYELLAEKGKCPPLVRKLLPHYEEGMTAYSEQRWDVAIAAFAECLKINDKDGPSRAYLERCKQLAEQTGVEHWDGSFTLETTGTHLPPFSTQGDSRAKAVVGPGDLFGILQGCSFPLPPALSRPPSRQKTGA